MSAAVHDQRQVRRGGDLAALALGIGLGITVAIGISTITNEELHQASGLITVGARFAALIGTYFALVGLLMVARIPPIERSVGHDRLVTWHRKLGPWSLYLIGLHVVLVILGYSMNDRRSVSREFWTLVTTYQWMLPAAVGFILMVMAGVTSYKKARAHMSYETWWVIHLYTYLAIGLAFMHQILTGEMFIGHRLNKAWWIGLYVVVAASMVAWRIVLPLFRSLRHQLIVARVVIEGPGVISVHIKGRKLDKLGAQGGQFFGWRFMTRNYWWQSHPYSLSAAPRAKMLRITVKDLGDHSRSLAQLKPGTRVLVEGPYGVFTADRAIGRNVLLVGGGVGITPLRALLEEVPSGSSVDVIYRTSKAEDLVLKQELDYLAEQTGSRIHYLIGSRAEFPLTPNQLAKIVPDVAKCDVYVCGPEALVHRIRHSVEALGVPSDRFHDEAFAFHSV